MSEPSGLEPISKREHELLLRASRGDIWFMGQDSELAVFKAYSNYLELKKLLEREEQKNAEVSAMLDASRASECRLVARLIDAEEALLKSQERADAAAAKSLEENALLRRELTKSGDVISSHRFHRRESNDALAHIDTLIQELLHSDEEDA